MAEVSATDAIAQYRGPVLLAHGDDDHVVPLAHMGRLSSAARHARALGLDLIITDHHEPDDQLPDCCAVVNPKRHDCNYPDKNLAGVGVALKLVQANPDAILVVASGSGAAMAAVAPVLAGTGLGIGRAAS